MKKNALDEVTLFTDGAAKGNPGPAGIGIVLQAGDGSILAEISESIGHATNNEAEYRAVIRGLSQAIKLKVRKLRLVTDSELVARQITGVYKVKTEHLRSLNALVRDLAASLDGFRVEHTMREGNKRADELASAAAKRSSCASSPEH